MLNVVLTCEHAGNQIPHAYSDLFKNGEKILASHQGLDIGAFQLAEYFSKYYPQFFYSKVSRLFIELNRSIWHPQLYSPFLQQLTEDEKKRILVNYYLPYRNQVMYALESLFDHGEQVLHLSIHTFTPELNGEVRNTDIGFLYDPRRKREKNFCKLWKQTIYSQTRQFRVRYNYPYLGKADGFVTALRKKYPEDQYIGMELEVNQKYYLNDSSAQIEQLLLNTFESALQKF